MGSVMSTVVFQPPTEDDVFAYKYLVQCSSAMKYIDLPDGSRVSYLRFDPECAATRLVILYSHGNAEHLGTCAANLKYLSSILGASVIAYDYRGYGRSGPISAPSDASVYEDADAVYAHVTGTGPQQLRIPQDKVIIMGRSVGGGPAMYLAEKHHEHVAGLILQSTFTSCLDVPRIPFLSTCCLCFDMFDNASRMKHVTGCPILLMHGDGDRVVPFNCSEKLFAIATKARSANSTRAASLSVSQHFVAGGSTAPLAESTWATNPPKMGYSTFQTPPTSSANDVYFQRFPGCDHNDMESRLPEVYKQTMQSFVLALSQ